MGKNKKNRKKELHLLCNRKLVELAWSKGLNLSRFLDNKLMEYFGLDEKGVDRL